ncbi:glycogen-binding subunit 76A [Solenopsis invicta]|uniref:glycogen-binding subunit 76A n=1 Tax=Solenopsis invicta TaxID=13686 RepID=UPI000595F5FC|nr:glycogen-binding subunit 76A [Solenopsis invicta]
MIVTQKGIQDESKTSAEQTKSMNGNSASLPAGRGNDLTSPLPLEGRHAEETSDATVLKMDSMDSAGNARGPSCGLVSSLLPSSCRGSAEAFARCLHRRLTSLGNENDSPERSADAAKPCETSWLHPSSSNRHVIASNLTNNQHPIFQHQPRHSSELDLFYDIEVEEAEVDGPGSPPEEATAAELAHLLVNPESLKASHHDACHCSPSGTKMTSGVTGAHQDPESCVFASPITGTPPDSDSSEVFFDPESSDADKSKGEVYFDPISSTSDSETTNLSNASALARTKLTLNGRERKRTEMHPERCDDTTSESSCSSRRNPASCENGRRQEGLVCSSEDSLNGRSSQETTSPSHESLWSTFDDSTVSLQDESPSRTIQDSVIPHICLPKSHSDSELPNNGISTVQVFNKLDKRDEEEEKEEEMNEREVDDVHCINGISKNVMCEVRNGSLFMTQDVETDSDLTVKDDSFNGAENVVNVIENMDNGERIELKSETLPKNLSQLKVEEITSDTDTDHSSYGSTIDISDALTMERSNFDAPVTEAISRNELKLKIEKNDSDEEKLCLLLKKFGSSSIAKEEDSSPEQESHSEIVEEEEDRPQRVRRCSSLKTGKTPPGTPHRKKIVRFADKLGLDLADVRMFMDEIPKIPNSAYSDLIYDDTFRPDSNTDNTVSTGDDWCDRYPNDGRRRSTPAIPKKIDRMLVPLFQQPGGLSNFLDIVRERKVCLENVVIQDPVTLALQGTVRVINLDFHKSVHVRYSLNSWRNFSDLQATYVPNSCDGFSDKFSFILYCHTLLVGQRLEFAVRFQCKGAQHWDNNAGANYCFQCLPASSSTGYIPITADECRRGSWTSTFY